MAKILLKLIIVILAIFVSIASTDTYAQQAASTLDKEDKIVISTYYPSPYAVFNELQLIPHDEPVSECNVASAQGTVYLNTQNQLFVCDGQGGWLPLGGGYWKLTENSRLHTVDLGWSIGIGTSTPSFRLDVAGRMNGREGVCIDGNCKNSWDWLSCPDLPGGQKQCLTYANFNTPLQGALSSSTTFTCTPCGGGTGATPPPTPGPWLQCGWVNVPPAYTNPPKGDCGDYTGVLWACACPPGYTNIINMSCGSSAMVAPMTANRYYDSVNKQVWMYCEGKVTIPCGPYGPIYASVTGHGQCAIYQP